VTVAKKVKKTRGGELAEQFTQALHAVEQVPLPGARDLPILYGIDRRGDFTEPQENVLIKAAEILVQSKRVYKHGDSIVMEVEEADGTGASLVALRIGADVENGARGFLANLFVCEYKGKQFPPPGWFVAVLLRADTVLQMLPEIKWYAKRPVFDANFQLRGPGWHPDAGILVHGPEIEPVVQEAGEVGGPALERLPHHLHTLLRGFCFRSDADIANTVGMMLTAVLVHSFIECGKATIIVDGNQPSLGKTWLVRCVGIVSDGVEPRMIHFTQDDEELAKRICATLREGRQSILLIDNAKVPGGNALNSPTIEANSMAPEISLRILKESRNYNRPNDLLWCMTMNNTRTTSDQVERSLPIRMYYEGRAADRTFDGPDPIRYAREHRLDILGELVGMVVRWNQQGRPLGHQSHRLHEWAGIIGGTLEVAGLPEFLANASDAAACFNTELDELAALAEAVIEAEGGPYIVFHDDADEGD
jgi:hypothetical protein